MNDIELGNSAKSKSYHLLSDQEQDDNLFPNSSTHSKPLRINENENESDDNPTATEKQKIPSNSGENNSNYNTKGKLRKLIKQGSDVGLLLLSQTAPPEQSSTTKKAHILLKRSSGRLDRLLESKRPSQGLSSVNSSEMISPHNNGQTQPDVPNQNMNNRLSTIASPVPTIASVESPIQPHPPIMGVMELDGILCEDNNSESDFLALKSFQHASDSNGYLPQILIDTATVSVDTSVKDSFSPLTDISVNTELSNKFRDAIYLNNVDEIRKYINRELEGTPNYARRMNIALWHACAHGSDQSASVLIKEGKADPSFVHNNVPCIQIATRRGFIELVEILLKKDPKLVDNKVPNNATITLEKWNSTKPHLRSDSIDITTNQHAKRKGRRLEGLRVVKMPNTHKSRINENEIDSINIEYAFRSTPLHQAALSNDVDVVKKLVETYNADIEAKDYNFKTPLMYAAELGGVEALKYLLECEAKIDHVDTNGNTALMHSIKNGNRQCILLLLRKGADVKVKDFEGRDIWEVAKDETICFYLARLFLEDEVSVPLHGLVKKGYNSCFKMIIENTVKFKGDSWKFDLRKFQMNSDGVLPDDNESYREENKSLAQLIISTNTTVDFVDSLSFQVQVQYWMRKYGYYYLAMKLLFYIVHISALTLFFVEEANKRDSCRWSLNEPKNILQIVSFCIVLLSWFMHLMFEITEFVLRCRTEVKELRDKQRKQAQASFQEDLRLGGIAILIGFKDYFTHIHNVIDACIILCFPSFLIFCVINSPIQWYFATFLYFARAIEIVKTFKVSSFGIYIHTIWTTLSRDLPKFVFIVIVSLFTFTGTFYISLRAPSNGYINQTAIEDKFGVEKEGQTSYEWLLLTSIRLLIEQGSVVKLDYITIFNWLAVIVFFLGLAWILLILRVIFIAGVSHTFGQTRIHAEKFATSYKLEYLVSMQENSFISLIFDLKKRYYIPSIDINRRDMRKYFETEGNYQLWNGLWVNRVEEAQKMIRNRNMLCKDEPDLPINDEIGNIAARRASNLTNTSNVNLITIVDQHYLGIKELIETSLAIYQERVDLKLKQMQLEFDSKTEELNYKLDTIMQELLKSDKN